MSYMQDFCGLAKNESYIVYDEARNTFSKCFLWTAISSPCHLILAIVCTYQFGNTKTSSKQKSCLVVGGTLLSSAACLNDLVELFLCYILRDRQDHPPAYVLTKSISFVGWLMCSITYHKKRSNKYTLVALIFVIISSSIKIQFVLQNILLRNYSIENVPVTYIGDLIGFWLSILIFLNCLCINFGTMSSTQTYETINDEKTEEIYLGNADTTRNIFSRLVYWWTNPLLKKGIQMQLESPDDLFLLPEYLNTRKMTNNLKKELGKEKELSSKKLTTRGNNDMPHNGTPNVSFDMLQNGTPNVSLFTSLNKCFGKLFYSSGILKLLTTALQLIQPMLVHFLVNFISDKKEPIVHGYYYALGFLLSTLLSVLFDLHYRYNTSVVSLQVRAALTSVIYQKIFVVRPSSLNKFSTGKVANLMSTDIDRVCLSCTHFHECWSIPLQIIVCLVLLYQQVGVSFLATIIFCILLVPIALRLANKIFDYQMKVLSQRDTRIKMMCEILFGIRVIKYNAWEKHFTKAIDNVRNSTLKLMYKQQKLLAVIEFAWGMSVPVISLLIIGGYVLTGHKLNAAKVFTCVALINRLVDPLNEFSWIYNILIEAWISLKRIEKYLHLPELHLIDYYSKEITVPNTSAIVINDGIFSWNSEEEEEEMKDEEKSGCCGGDEMTESGDDDDDMNSSSFELQIPSVSIKQGQFVGITGKVGAGKSSLFASITANMEKHAGHVSIDRKFDGFAYITQEPWIQHQSIRDNILFGREYDETKYREVVYACALREDIKNFPAGDLTEIGENGINLSGGQKARVALARAIYQEKDLYLLDDPIAAVDSRVAKHLYKNCIMGLLKNKTRLLCTHHKEYLREVDQIILLNDGEIEAHGTPDEVLDANNLSFEREGDDNKEESINQHTGKNDDMVGKLSEGKFVDEEEMQEGTVSWNVYKRYWTSFGSTVATLVVLAKMLEQAAYCLQNWWLSRWVSDSEDARNSSVYGDISSRDLHLSHYEISNDSVYHLSIYCYIILGDMFFLAIAAFGMSYGCVQASKVLHEQLLRAIMKSTFSFFDATPVGRIINRFSSDIGAIDDEFSFVLAWLLREVLYLTGMVILVCYSLPTFVLFLVPLGLAYYFIQRRYRKSSRELKRISAVSLSPLYEHFGETIAGKTVIKAFQDEKRFITENEVKLERSQRAQYNEQLARIWLAFRLDMICVVLVTSISLLAVLEHKYGRINAGLVGLAITSAIQITPILGSLLTSFTETEKQMVRVERIAEYIDEIPQETKKTSKVASEWPNKGNICFYDVSLQYRENLPYALQDVTLDIKGGEKIGICGRTGSGKSTLFKVLFNVIDMSQGSVYIDGENISKIDHSILRSRMSIIPQDPFLFDDTVATNLDPTGECSATELLDVLRKCHLEKLVEDLGGLEGKVGEKGSNLSTGQKQLLCLARALLKKSKIICIDEATASVDLETDKLIQATICEEFSENTVLTIAHRMNTITESDRVIVMKSSRVVEFNSPAKLLADPNSEFYALVNERTST